MRTDRSVGRIISRDKEAEEQTCRERDKHRLSGGEDLSRAGRDFKAHRVLTFFPGQRPSQASTLQYKLVLARAHQYPLLTDTHT